MPVSGGFGMQYGTRLSLFIWVTLVWVALGFGKCLLFFACMLLSLLFNSCIADMAFHMQVSPYWHLFGFTCVWDLWNISSLLHGFASVYHGLGCAGMASRVSIAAAVGFFFVENWIRHIPTSVLWVVFPACSRNQGYLCITHLHWFVHFLFFRQDIFGLVLYLPTADLSFLPVLLQCVRLFQFPSFELLLFLKICLQVM